MKNMFCMPFSHIPVIPAIPCRNTKKSILISFWDQPGTSGFTKWHAMAAKTTLTKWIRETNTIGERTRGRCKPVYLSGFSLFSIVS